MHCQQNIKIWIWNWIDWRC